MYYLPSIIENYDYDDDSTIATNFDDDASIATALTSPQNVNYAFDGDDYDNSDIYKSQSVDQYALADIDSSYGDTVINVPESFNDIRLGGGLSFGGDGDFDGPEYDGGGKAVDNDYGDTLDSFGDSGLGGFGMHSPGQDHRNISIVSPAPPAVTGNDELNRPWANTTTVDKGDDLDQPWATTTTPDNKDSDLDRPWATTSSKEKKTDQPRKWFSAWGAGKGT